MRENSLIESLSASSFARALLDTIPCGVMVLDENRQIRAVNDVMVQALCLPAKAVIGKRGGEVLGCIYADWGEEPCGIKIECEHCEARRLALAAFHEGTRQRSRVTVRIWVDGIMREVDLKLSASPFQYRGRKLVLILLEDTKRLSCLKHKSAQQRRHGIVGESRAIREVMESIHEVAPTSAPVLIQGETGTGKELVALSIHRESLRAVKHCVTVNCAALPQGLLESELFGHVRGAFTGAVQDKKGRFDLADCGTIFLDEIGEMDMSLQTKLLRILQEGDFEPLGSLKTKHVDVRVVSATNKDLLAEVERGKFRADLYYRLCVVPITIPPLRERIEDIPLLADHFLSQFAEDSEFGKAELSPDVLRLLMQRKWPGNVRELRNVIQFAAIKSRGCLILPEHLPPSYRVSEQTPTLRAPTERKLRREEVTRALEAEGGNKMKAAKRLRVSRSTLYRFLGDREG